MSGTLINTIPLPGLSGVIPSGQQHMNVNLTLPDQVNIGLRQAVTDDLTAALTYQWTHWSIFNRFIVNTPAGPAVPLNFAYNNGWLLSVGGEYKLNEKATLRAGTGFERSPINDSNRDPRLPDTDRYYLAVGCSYQFTPQFSGDVGYQHVFTKSGAINLTDSSNSHFLGVPYVGSVNTHVDVLSLTLNYRFDTPPAAVVAKY